MPLSSLQYDEQYALARRRHVLKQYARHHKLTPSDDPSHELMRTFANRYLERLVTILLGGGGGGDERTDAAAANRSLNSTLTAAAQQETAAAAHSTAVGGYNLNKGAIGGINASGVLAAPSVASPQKPPHHLAPLMDTGSVKAALSSTSPSHQQSTNVNNEQKGANRSNVDRNGNHLQRPPPLSIPPLIPTGGTKYGDGMFSSAPAHYQVNLRLWAPKYRGKASVSLSVPPTIVYDDWPRFVAQCFEACQGGATENNTVYTAMGTPIGDPLLFFEEFISAKRRHDARRQLRQLAWLDGLVVSDVERLVDTMNPKEDQMFGKQDSIKPPRFGVDDEVFALDLLCVEKGAGSGGASTNKKNLAKAASSGGGDGVSTTSSAAADPDHFFSVTNPQLIDIIVRTFELPPVSGHSTVGGDKNNSNAKGAVGGVGGEGSSSESDDIDEGEIAAAGDEATEAIYHLGNPRQREAMLQKQLAKSITEGTFKQALGKNYHRDRFLFQRRLFANDDDVEITNDNIFGKKKVKVSCVDGDYGNNDDANDDEDNARLRKKRTFGHKAKNPWSNNYATNLPMPPNMREGNEGHAAQQQLSGLNNNMRAKVANAAKGRAKAANGRLLVLREVLQGPPSTAYTVPPLLSNQRLQQQQQHASRPNSGNTRASFSDLTAPIADLPAIDENTPTDLISTNMRDVIGNDYIDAVERRANAVEARRQHIMEVIERRTAKLMQKRLVYIPKARRNGRGGATAGGHSGSDGRSSATASNCSSDNGEDDFDDDENVDEGDARTRTRRPSTASQAQTQAPSRPGSGGRGILRRNPSGTGLNVSFAFAEGDAAMTAAAAEGPSSMNTAIIGKGEEEERATASAASPMAVAARRSVVFTGEVGEDQQQPAPQHNHDAVVHVGPPSPIETPIAFTPQRKGSAPATRPASSSSSIAARRRDSTKGDDDEEDKEEGQRSSSTTSSYSEMMQRRRSSIKAPTFITAAELHPTMIAQLEVKFGAHGFPTLHNPYDGDGGGGHDGGGGGGDSKPTGRDVFTMTALTSQFRDDKGTAAAVSAAMAATSNNRGKRQTSTSIMNTSNASSSTTTAAGMQNATPVAFSASSSSSSSSLAAYSHMVQSHYLYKDPKVLRAFFKMYSSSGGGVGEGGGEDAKSQKAGKKKGGGKGGATLNFSLNRTSMNHPLPSLLQDMLALQLAADQQVMACMHFIAATSSTGTSAQPQVVGGGGGGSTTTIGGDDAKDLFRNISAQQILFAANGPLSWLLAEREENCRKKAAAITTQQRESTASSSSTTARRSTTFLLPFQPSSSTSPKTPLSAAAERNRKCSELILKRLRQIQIRRDLPKQPHTSPDLIKASGANTTIAALKKEATTDKPIAPATVEDSLLQYLSGGVRPLPSELQQSLNVSQMKQRRQRMLRQQQQFNQTTTTSTDGGSCGGGGGGDNAAYPPIDDALDEGNLGDISAIHRGAGGDANDEAGSFGRSPRRSPLHSPRNNRGITHGMRSTIAALNDDDNANNKNGRVSPFHVNHSQSMAIHKARFEHRKLRRLNQSCAPHEMSSYGSTVLTIHDGTAKPRNRLMRGGGGGGASGSNSDGGEGAATDDDEEDEDEVMARRRAEEKQYLISGKKKGGYDFSFIHDDGSSKKKAAASSLRFANAGIVIDSNDTPSAKAVAQYALIPQGHAVVGPSPSTLLKKSAQPATTAIVKAQPTPACPPSQTTAAKQSQASQNRKGASGHGNNSRPSSAAASSSSVPKDAITIDTPITAYRDLLVGDQHSRLAMQNDVLEGHRKIRQRKHLQMMLMAASARNGNSHNGDKNDQDDGAVNTTTHIAASLQHDANANPLVGSMEEESLNNTTTIEASLSLSLAVAAAAEPLAATPTATSPAATATVTAMEDTMAAYTSPVRMIRSGPIPYGLVASRNALNTRNYINGATPIGTMTAAAAVAALEEDGGNTIHVVAASPMKAPTSAGTAARSAALLLGNAATNSSSGGGVVGREDHDASLIGGSAPAGSGGGALAVTLPTGVVRDRQGRHVQVDGGLLAVGDIVVSTTSGELYRVEGFKMISKAAHRCHPPSSSASATPTAPVTALGGGGEGKKISTRSERKTLMITTGEEEDGATPSLSPASAHLKEDNMYMRRRSTVTTIGTLSGLAVDKEKGEHAAAPGPDNSNMVESAHSPAELKTATIIEHNEAVRDLLLSDPNSTEIPHILVAHCRRLVKATDPCLDHFVQPTLRSERHGLAYPCHEHFIKFRRYWDSVLVATSRAANGVVLKGSDAEGEEPREAENGHDDAVDAVIQERPFSDDSLVAESAMPSTTSPLIITFDDDEKQSGRGEKRAAPPPSRIAADSLSTTLNTTGNTAKKNIHERSALLGELYRRTSRQRATASTTSGQSVSEEMAVMDEQQLQFESLFLSDAFPQLKEVISALTQQEEEECRDGPTAAMNTCTSTDKKSQKRLAKLLAYALRFSAGVSEHNSKLTPSAMLARGGEEEEGRRGHAHKGQSPSAAAANPMDASVLAETKARWHKQAQNALLALAAEVLEGEEGISNSQAAAVDPQHSSITSVVSGIHPSPAGVTNKSAFSAPTSTSPSTTLPAKKDYDAAATRHMTAVDALIESFIEGVLPSHLAYEVTAAAPRYYCSPYTTFLTDECCDLVCTQLQPTTMERSLMWLNLPFVFALRRMLFTLHQRADDGLKKLLRVASPPPPPSSSPPLHVLSSYDQLYGDAPINALRAVVECDCADKVVNPPQRRGEGDSTQTWSRIVTTTASSSSSPPPSHHCRTANCSLPNDLWDTARDEKKKRETSENRDGKEGTPFAACPPSSAHSPYYDTRTTATTSPSAAHTAGLVYRSLEPLVDSCYIHERKMTMDDGDDDEASEERGSGGTTKRIPTRATDCLICECALRASLFAPVK